MTPAKRARVLRFVGVLIFAVLVGLGIVGIAYATHDTDGDGWSDEYEIYLPTGHLRPCPLHLGDAAWPPDLNNDTTVDVINDLSQLAGDFAKSITDPNVAHREDIAPEPDGDQFIDIFDIAKAAGLAFTSCTP